ncbi:helix-turn-helix domain-containing protein [Embleya hyalina]|uniref:Membrane protein n=1 Tax=Embleya hyalina TaxID=516124 RepID=A0A401YP61_9ACTN|nr:helix-turn-helix domain-containing protein [Embleya hyalina]GCD96345.1 membrane protein [Embleya hyalina]
MSIGRSLAEARVRAGLTVERLSEVTRIRQAIIEGVEHDDFEPCGGDFYARGHIRTLARATGLEPAPLIAEYDHTVGGTSTPRPTEIFDSPRKSIEYRRPNWTLAMGVAVVIVLIFAFVQLAGGRADDDEKETASRVAPTTAAPAAPAPPPPPPSPAAPVSKAPEFPAGVVVTVTAVDGRSWIRAFDSKDRQILETILDKGEAKTFEDPARLQVQVGNSGAARLNVNGRDLGPAGEDGEVVKHTFVPGDPVPQMRTSASATPSSR